MIVEDVNDVTMNVTIVFHGLTDLLLEMDAAVSVYASAFVYYFNAFMLHS